MIKIKNALKKGMVAAAIGLSIFSFTPSADAAIETVTGTGEYTMGNGDSIQHAQDGATNLALRAAAEQAGVYVESYTKTENLALTQDQVIAATGSVLKVKSKTFNKQMTPNGDIHITCIVIAEADTDSIIAALKDAISRANGTKANVPSAPVSQPSGNVSTVPAQSQPNNDDRESAQGYIDSSKQELIEWNFANAMDMVRQAIAFAPNWGACYTAKGDIYMKMKRKSDAVDSYKHAIEVDPSYPNGYIYLAGIMLDEDTPAYDRKRVRNKIIDYCNKAIALSGEDNSNEVELAYYYLGCIYSALSDCTNNKTEEFKYLNLAKENWGNAIALLESKRSHHYENEAHMEMDLRVINGQLQQDVD